jgi:predicted esterase
MANITIRRWNSWMTVALSTGLSVATLLVPAWAQRTTIAFNSESHSACESFGSMTIPANVMRLATNGAKVTSALANGASGVPPRTVGSFCRVLVDIASVDPAAPPIKMEINFPDTWNGKALMYGGGGYNGVILSTGGAIRLQPNDMPIPLGRGYVTFGGNSGHEGAGSGVFALNDEALRNYAFDAVKKTRDVAGHLIKLRYGRPADKVYFHGSSNGGKEALGLIQRHPADLDGALVFWPATFVAPFQLQAARISRAFAEPGAYLSIAKRQELLNAAMDACDDLDGVRDGLISNVRVCQERFDPATATVSGRPLRCASGADDGDACLSDAQIKALKVMSSPLKLTYALESGETQYPGYYLWGADLGTKMTDDLTKGVMTQGLGTIAPGFPAAPGMPFLHNYSDQFVRYFVTKDPKATWKDIDPEKPGEWQSQLAWLGGLLDMPKTDLSEFQKRGSKIILVHGLADQIVPPEASVDYYNRLAAAMGRETVSRFVKFYEIPGTAHSGFGIAFNPTWDALGALDEWVVNGVAPVGPIVTDTYFKPGRTRPLCEYPMWPKFKGAGDVELAASFECVR